MRDLGLLSGKAPPSNFMIVDDHPMYRDALASSVSRRFQGCRIETAGSVSALFDALDQGFEPDFIIFDLILPGVTGLSGFQQVRDRLSDCPILVVSSVASSETVEALMEEGAAGFMPKDASAEQFGALLSEIAKGRVYHPKDILHLWGLRGNAGDDAWTHPKLAALPPQQRRVLDLICQGKPNKQIAYELDLALATVKAHITVLLRRLGVNNRTQAAILVESLRKKGGALGRDEPDASMPH